MSNYEHDRVRNRLSELSNCPNDDPGFEEWIKAKEHIDFLHDNSAENELVVCAIDQHAFIQTAVIAEDKLPMIDKEDLLNWNDFGHSSASYNHDSSQDSFQIQRDYGFSGSKALENARRLVYVRSFEGLYPEILQEYLHVANVHWIPEKKAYCDYNELGDLEPVVSLTPKRHEGYICLASFSRGPLELYLSASNSIAIRCFDFTLFRMGGFRGWSNKGIVALKEEDEMFYHQKIEPGNGSYTRGVQIIRPSRTKSEIFAALKRDWYGEDEQYVEFVARDLFSGQVMTISTDPASTTYRGDTQSSLPCELSPAFFRPELLLKYKADPDKYTVRTRRISCRSIWGISYDVNEAGQVHAYVCDLRKLPYQEQQYWVSFNEEPKGDISPRAFEQDFLARWSTLDPIDEIVEIFRQWNKSNTAFWKLRDEALLDRVSTPYTESRDQWAVSYLDLAQLSIEGFYMEVIRNELRKRKVHFLDDERSLTLLERLISDIQDLDTPERLEGLRTVQTIRTKVKAHSGGREASDLGRHALEEHGTYAAHFNHVCKIVLEELKRIEEAFAISMPKDGES